MIVASRQGLGQLTRDRSKVVLPVIGKPLIARIVDRLHKSRYSTLYRGCRRTKRHWRLASQQFVAARCAASDCPPALSTQPTDALARLDKGLTGPFSIDLDRPLDPIGSFWQSDPALPGIARLSSWRGVHDAQGESGALLSVSVEGDWITGISQVGSSIRNLACFMPYICDKRMLARPTVHDDWQMTAAIQELVANGGKVACVKADWQLHLAREIDLLTINKRFLHEGRDAYTLSELPASVEIHPPVRIDPRVSVGPKTHISPNVYIERRARIGQEATIRDCLVLERAEIADRESVRNQNVGRALRIVEEEPQTERTRPTRPQGWEARLETQRKVHKDDQTHILVIDDESTFHEIATFFIERLGCLSLHALDGQEGEIMALAYHPTLILLDIMMPAQNGYETCQRLRQQGYRGAITMMSALQEATGTNKAGESGANGYMMKPLDASILALHLEYAQTGMTYPTFSEWLRRLG